MAETSIAWTHYTFNPWWGCVKVSPGCEHCYAEAWAHRMGKDLWGPASTTERRFFGDAHWREPIVWARRRRRGDARHLVFCASMADVFEEVGAAGRIPEARARLWRLIEETPDLTWQLLTKRPENVARMVPVEWERDGWPANVWLLTTVEDQQRADERLPEFLCLRAKVKGVSCEPLLGPLDLSRYLRGWQPEPVHVCGSDPELCEARCPDVEQVESPRLSWVIVGGESGHEARPFDQAWARSIRDQCVDHRVPFFMKQCGSRPYDSLVAWKMLDRRREPSPQEASTLAAIEYSDAKGGDVDEWPEDLRVRELPA
jgi:protein gp37